jgi:hypothetical protein
MATKVKTTTVQTTKVTKEEVTWVCKKCKTGWTTQGGALACCGTKRGACYRCGRTSHYANECYASTHRRGYDLDD